MEHTEQREKLINLIINAKRADPETGSFTEFLADFLLGYGVIVPDDDCDVDRLRELVEADRAGRIVILPDFCETLEAALKKTEESPENA